MGSPGAVPQVSTNSEHCGNVLSMRGKKPKEWSWFVGLEQAMRALVALALRALLLGIPSVALALRFEAFGNEPHPAVPGSSQELLQVINLRSRVYFLGGDGPNIYYFRGNAADLQEALDKFARIK